MTHPILSFSLVGVQFATLLYLILTSPFRFAQPLSFVFFASGIILGLSSLYAMRQSRWNIRPDVPESGLLVTQGPYALLRHPMYAAVLCVALGLLLEEASGMRLAASAILFADLNIKYRYEEWLLERAFGQTYRAYRARTKALIPYVY